MIPGDTILFYQHKFKSIKKMASVLDGTDVIFSFVLYLLFQNPCHHFRKISADIFRSIFGSLHTTISSTHAAITASVRFHDCSFGSVWPVGQ